MKKGFKLFGLLAVAFFFLNTDTVNKLDLQPAKNIEGRNFDFRYTGTLEVGDGVMPLIGQLSKDGKNMYITSQNSRGGKMLYKMTRDELGSAFGAPEKVEGILNAGGYDVLMPSLSADENVLVFVNSENGMQNGNDLFIASKDENGEYGNIRNLKEINHPSLSDAYPWLSADGLRLYFTKQKGAKITFWTAERKDLESEFSGLTEMGLELPKISNNMSCMLSADELEVYALSGENIYYAKRSTVDSPFSLPVEIANTSNNGYMSGITMTDDTKELFVYNSIGFRNTQVLKFTNAEAGHNSSIISNGENGLR